MKRPPSYSEGSIIDIDYYRTNLLIRPLIEDTPVTSNTAHNSNININTSIETPQNKPTIDYGQIIINKLCSFIFHLLLIAGFEILFFNFFILSYETNSIVSLVDQVAYPIINTCTELNNSSKIIIDNYINSVINQTLINQNAMKDYIQRIYINNQIFYKSVHYFIGIVSFLIGLIISNFCYFKKPIQFIVIVTDNIIMILILGIYEYIFFKNIVFQYQIIYPNEIIQNLIENIVLNC